MAENPGEMNFRYNVDQASIKNAIDAVNSINKAIDDGTVDMRGWSQQAAKAAEIIESYTKGSAATADSVKAIASAFHGWKMELDQLPADLTGVANAVAMLYTSMNLVATAAAELKAEDFVGQKQLNALREATLDLDGQTQAVKQNTEVKREATQVQSDLDDELERQLAIDDILQAQEGKGLGDYKPLHPSGVAIPNASDITPDLAEKYGLKREAEFNPPPQGLQDASEVLMQSMQITGAQEALQQMQNTLKLANDALLRMGTNIEDLDPSFQRLATKVLEFGDSNQKLVDVAKTIDAIRTNAGQLEGDGTVSLERVAIAVQNFEEKFRMFHINARDTDLGPIGFDAGNLIANQVKLPIGGATIPGAPEGVGPADFTSVTSRGYVDAENAVKEFNAALAEGAVEQSTQKDIINDLIRTFSSLKSEMSDGSETLDQLYNAFDKVQEAEEKLSGFHDLSDTFKDLEDSLAKGTTTTEELDVALVQLGEAKDRLKDFRDIAGIFVELNRKLEDGTARVSDMSDAVDRLSGFELELSDTPDYYQKLLTSLGLYVAEKQKVADMLVPQGGAGGAGGALPTGENNGLPFAGAGEVGGLSNELDTIKEKWISITDAQDRAIDNIGGITIKYNMITGQSELLVQDTKEYAQALDVINNMGGSAEKNAPIQPPSDDEQAAVLELTKARAEGQRQSEAAFAVIQKERDALGSEIDIVKSVNQQFILLDGSADDFNKQLEVAFNKSAQLHNETANWVVSIEESAAALESHQLALSGGAGGGSKPPQPPKGPDYTVPAEFGGAPNYGSSGVRKYDVGLGETEIQAKAAEDAINKITASMLDLSAAENRTNKSAEEFSRQLIVTNKQYASLVEEARQLHQEAQIDTIVDQFVALTKEEGNAATNLLNMTRVLDSLPGIFSEDIDIAIDRFDQLVKKEEQLISIQDQINAKPLNLTVAGSGSNIPGAPDSAKATDNTYNIAFDASARSAAEVQANLSAIQQDLLAINPAADRTAFAFQNIAAASQEVRQIAAIDNLVKQFGDLYDPITQGDEALGQMVSQMQQIGALPEQIEQAAQAFRDLQASALQAAGAEAQNAKIIKDIADAKNALNQQALSPTDADFGGDATGNLGQRAVPAEGLRRTGTAISQLGLGNKDIQQVGTDIRLIGDVQQVNKEIGLLATAFENLPGAMGEAARASAALATGIAGPVAGSFAALLTVVAPFGALLAVGAIAWQKLQEEMKGANDALTEANSAVKSYYTAIQEGTSASIADQLQKAKDQKNIQDEILKTQTDAMAHGFESAQNQFGDPLARLFFLLGQSGLSGGDAMKKMQKEMDDAAGKSVELAGAIDGMTRAQSDAQVQVNQVNADLIKSASDQMAVARQEATDSTMTGDALRKRLTDLREERTLLEGSNNVLNSSKDKNSALNAELAKNNDALNKNGLEIARITDNLLPEIDARERETAAIKAQEEALDASAKKLIAGTDKLIADDVARKKLEQTGTSAGVKGTVVDYQTEIDSIQQNLPRIKSALDLAKELDSNKGLKTPSKETQDLQAEFDKLSARLTDLKDKVSDYTSSLIPELQAKERQTDITKELTSETDSYLKKQEDETTLRQQDSEKMLSIEQDYSNKLINIAQKARDAAAQALEELKAKQTEDLQKLSDSTTDDQTKLAITKRDAQIKFGEQEVKDWTDHLNKLADLRQKAHDSEYDDIANRDFAALARDQRKLTTELNTENTSYSQKEAQKQTQLADELKMDDLHAKDQAAQRLVEYERANRDAQQQYDKRLQAAKDAAQKEKDAADAARAQEIAAEVAHFHNLMAVREEKYQEELNLLRKHLQDEIDVINGTSVNTQGGNGYSYGPQNQGATQPYSNPNPGLQVYSPSMYQGGGMSSGPQISTTVTGNTIALPNLQDLVNGVENAGLSLLQNFLNS